MQALRLARLVNVDRSDTIRKGCFVHEGASSKDRNERLFAVCELGI